MLSLYPALQRKMILLMVGLLAICIALIAAGSSPIVISVLLVLGEIGLVLSTLMKSAELHSGLLAVLYQELDVQRFVREYEPFLKLNPKNKNIFLSIRLHLSNAYCAQGRFDEAMDLLKSLSIDENAADEETLTSAFAVVSNLCFCAEQKGDIAVAEAYFTRLDDMQKRLESMQAGKPDKKKCAFNIDLNRLCLEFLKTGKPNVEALRSIQANNRMILHQVTTGLWIARAYLAENRRKDAEQLLSKIVERAPELYPGREAKAMLEKLQA